MNAADDQGPELGGDDALAAEYVLGVLSAEERAEAARRIDAEGRFARVVDSWEERFAPLAAAYPPVEPSAKVRQAIEQRLHRAGAPAPGRAGMWASVSFWRGLTVASFAALAIAVAMPLVTDQPGQGRMVASLSAADSDVRYVAIYDVQKGDIGLSHLSGERGEAKDFELWMIAGKDAPKSLGVIAVGQTVRVAMPPPMRERMAEGAVFAISLEPTGGSPTGAPTGPVVAAGDLRSI